MIRDHRTFLPVAMARYFLQRPMVDTGLLIALTLVSMLGLAVLYSAAESNMQVLFRQLVRLGIGLAVMMLISRIQPRTLQTWSPPMFVFSIALLVLVALLGEGRGADRWLDLGLVRFQPSELLKLTVPMMLAWYLQVNLPNSYAGLNARTYYFAAKDILASHKMSNKLISNVRYNTRF